MSRRSFINLMRKILTMRTKRILSLMGLEGVAGFRADIGAQV